MSLTANTTATGAPLSPAASTGAHDSITSRFDRNATALDVVQGPCAVQVVVGRPRVPQHVRREVPDLQECHVAQGVELR